MEKLATGHKGQGGCFIEEGRIDFDMIGPGQAKVDKKWPIQAFEQPNHKCLSLKLGPIEINEGRKDLSTGCGPKGTHLNKGKKSVGAIQSHIQLGTRPCGGSKPTLALCLSK